MQGFGPDKPQAGPMGQAAVVIGEVVSAFM